MDGLLSPPLSPSLSFPLSISLALSTYLYLPNSIYLSLSPPLSLTLFLSLPSLSPSLSHTHLERYSFSLFHSLSHARTHIELEILSLFLYLVLPFTSVFDVGAVHLSPLVSFCPNRVFACGHVCQSAFRPYRSDCIYVAILTPIRYLLKANSYSEMLWKITKIKTISSSTIEIFDN